MMKIFADRNRGAADRARSDQFRLCDEDQPAAVAAAAIWPRLQRLSRFRRIVLRWVSVAGSVLAEEAAAGTPFLFVPILIGIGALVYFTTRIGLGHVLLASVAICVGSQVAALRKFMLASGLVIAGWMISSLHTARLDTPMLGAPVYTTLTGEIVLIETTRTGRSRLTLEVRETSGPRLLHAPGRVRIVAANLSAAMRPGTVVKGRARLFPMQGPVRPGGYDFSFHAFHDGIGANGFFLDEPRGVAESDPRTLPEMVALRLEQARHRLTERIRERLPGQEGELAAALITGMQSGIADEISEVMRQTGLAHILSISGLHMALLAGLVMSAIRLAGALVPPFASSYPVRKFAAAGALVAVLLYLFISGAAVATIRAAIMLAVMLVAILVDRPSVTMRNLAIAALAVLLISPHEVLNPGFQMSFAATAALIAAYRAWTGWKANRQERTPSHFDAGPAYLAASAFRTVGALATTSLIAGLATGIFGVWHFHRAAPLGILANLAAMPVVSFAVMPLAILSVALIPLGLDSLAFTLLGGAISLVVAIASWFAERTPFDAVGAIPESSLLLATLGLVAVTLPATRLRLLGLPLLIASIWALSGRSLPHVLVSEDATLLGVHAGGLLSVNRTNASEFTLRVWQDATASSGILGPEPADSNPPTEDGKSAFQCGGNLCTIQLDNGAIVAHAGTEDAARRACGRATLIVLADPVAPADPCVALPAHERDRASPAPLVLHARELARKGAAEIRFGRVAEDGHLEPRVRFAIGPFWRPWHRHRAWSRAARGMSAGKTSPVARSP